MKKKMVSILTALCLCFCFIPNISFAAGTANDVVNVAYGEIDTSIGYKQQEFDGYTKYGDWLGNAYMEWCAAFVAWCANQAGVSSDVVPHYSSVSDMISFYSNRGLYYSASSYTPKAGDLAFLADFSHVAIVVSATSSKITTIEGNTTTSNFTGDTIYVSKKTRSISYFKGFAAPNYSAVNPDPPTITNFSTLYSEYSIGSNPSISMSASNIGHYDTWLYRDGELIESGSTTESTYIFNSTIQDGYTYSARVTAINDSGNTISDLIYFKLKSMPSILSVKSQKSSYYVGENPSISMNATNNGHYDVWLYNNGTLIETGSTTNNTYTFSSTIEKGNTYSFRITAINDYGSVISDLVILSTKEYDTLSIPKNEYSPEETITFTWSSHTTASHYDFYIYNEKGEIFITGTTTSTQISYKLDKGNYSARVTPVYNGGIVISNLISFSVGTNDDLSLQDFTVEKYNGYANITNNTSEQQGASVIFAKYNNGVLTDTEICEAHIAAEETLKINTDFGDDYKVFVWDNLSGMKPLCKSE